MGSNGLAIIVSGFWRIGLNTEVYFYINFSVLIPVNDNIVPELLPTRTKHPLC